MRHCVNCGAELPDADGRFCPGCGAPVAAGPPAFVPPVAFKRRRRGLSALWIVVGVVLVAGIGAAVYFLALREGGGTPREAEEPHLYPVSVGGTYGYIGESGAVVVEPRFELARFFSGGLAAVQSDGRWGYIDENGALAIRPAFGIARDFHEGLAWVEKDGSWRVIDTTGTVVIDPSWDVPDARDFSDGLSLVGSWKNDVVQYFYIDKTGETAIDLSFYNATPFSEGLAAVEWDSYGYIDRTGEWAIEQEYTLALPFSEGLGAVRVAGDRWGYVDKTGALVIQPRSWFSAGQFSEGLAAVGNSDASDDVTYGYIDQAGDYAIEPRFGDTEDFSQGLAAVESDGLWGYIDDAGEWVIEPRFFSASSFMPGGLALVSLNPSVKSEDAYFYDTYFSAGQAAYIDKSGEVVWQQP